MGWTPAVIIVVRHGPRLDAADKQWHLTSPTPYDPPLTYGGWTQSRALGARIASILRSRETDDEVPIANGESSGGESKRKRRHKVIVHTSPFLRCVQTSVAISAGLAQNPGHSSTKHLPSPAMKPMHTSPHISAMHSSPRLRPLNTGSPALLPIPEPGLLKAEQQDHIKKSTIRVDAFLGEWLSPDYFEQITPPPSSIMMVAGAKSDLLRREDYSSLTHIKDVAANQPFPGGWGSPIVAAKEKEEGPLSTLSALSNSLPRRERTSSLSSTGSHGSRHSHRDSPNLQAQTPNTQGIYQPPIPSYAISNSDPIPSGYVPHARDACVDVDYQWDSMREPQNWGNGGEYGEEWSQMHKRFRAGLNNMVSWYRDSEDPGKLLTKSGSRSVTPEDDGNDEDTDLVLILVTHGAGCNALIGALTNQPVLMDVGMASLTMAIRKPTPENTPSTSPTATPHGHSRTSSRTIGLSDQYDVKLVANTEHLRSSAHSTPSNSRAPSLTSAFRERFGTPNSLDGPTSRPTSSTNSNLGSIRRTATVAGGHAPRGYVAPRTNSIGLWSAPVPKPPEPEPESNKEEDRDSMMLSFGDDGTVDNRPDQEVKLVNEEIKVEKKHVTLVVDEKENDRFSMKTDSEPNTDADEAKNHEEERSESPGLWGAPKPPGLAEKIRDLQQPKRRWTVNERGAQNL